VRRQELLADARLPVEAMQRGLRGDTDQVAVPFLVFRQHQQMVIVVVWRIGAVVLCLAHVEFAAQDGLDALFLSSVKKVHCSIDISVIGHRNRFLTQRRYPAYELFNVASPVQQRVLRMQMQMRKFSHGYY
jgi:hypothetical protein